MYSVGDGADVEVYSGDRFSDDMLCYGINVAARLLTSHLARVLTPMSLAPGQVPALLALHEFDGQTQADLARRTSVEQPTMAITLRRMERDGLIYRTADGDDARKTRLHLTPTGRAVIDPLQSARGLIDSVALRGLTESQLETLTAVINTIVDNLTEPNT